MNTLNVTGITKDLSYLKYPLVHPFHNLLSGYSSLPTYVDGNGIYLSDSNGKEYLDFSSNLWNVSLGYNNKRINDAIIEQLKLLPYCSLFESTNDTAVKAAMQIISLLPDNFSKLMFTCSGSESLDLAIKIVREYHFQKSPEKRKILSFENAYHGTNYGGMSLSGISKKRANAYAPFVHEIEMLKEPLSVNKYEEGFFEGILNTLKNELDTNHRTIGGLVIEPIFVSHGAGAFPKNVMKNIIELCYQYDVLVVFDEVATGFYRTTNVFSFEYYNVNPDIICMSKGINSGYLPLGAVSFNDNVRNVLLEMHSPIIHGSTQGGNLLALAASIAALKEYSSIDPLSKMSQISEYISVQLKDRLQYHKNVGKIRASGSIIGIDIVNNYNEYVFLGGKINNKIVTELRKNGLILYASRIGILILPMYIVTIDQCNAMLDIIERTFRSLLF